MTFWGTIKTIASLKNKIKGHYSRNFLKPLEFFADGF